jgi:hypothetical protein
MNIAEKLTIPKSREIRAEAIQVLIDRLGITKAAFFIRENLSQKEDYLKIKEDLFGKKTAAEIFGEIKKVNF